MTNNFECKTRLRSYLTRGLLLTSGLLMLAGVVRTELTVASLGMASLIYLSYGLSRLLSIAIDGIPHSGLVSAAILEIASSFSQPCEDPNAAG